MLQAPQGQNTSKDEDKAKGDFAGHQNVAEGEAEASLQDRHSGDPLEGKAGEIGAGGMQSGGQAEQQSSEQRDGQGKDEDSPIGVDVELNGKVDGGMPLAD